MGNLDNTYKYVRDYIVHEDSLINLRLNWLLIIQGLLFSAYALSLKDSSSQQDTAYFRQVISGVGIATSLLVLPSIFSAVIAIKNLEAFWRKKQLKIKRQLDKEEYKLVSKKKQLETIKEQLEEYPFVTGGVDPEFTTKSNSEYMGDDCLKLFHALQYYSNLVFWTPYGIPLVFFCAWIYLLKSE